MQSDRFVEPNDYIGDITWVGTTSSGTAKLGWILAIKESESSGANRRRVISTH